MDNLTKKINLIDILGMMLPGGLTLILFENDIGFLNALSNSMGEQYDVVLWGVAFLLGSYFVGMMLHELGSMAEKLLWMNPLTDPRAYAALAAGRQMKLLEGRKLSWLDVAAVIGSFLGVSGLLSLAVGCVDFIGILTVSIVFAAAIAVVHMRHTLQALNNMKKASMVRDREKDFHEDAERFHAVEPTGENTRKMEVFNGFRTLARSVLVMFAVAQVYVILCEGNAESYLVSLAEHIQSVPALGFLRQLMVAALAARYWRFSCLRYQYRYAVVQNYQSEAQKQSV